MRNSPLESAVTLEPGRDVAAAVARHVSPSGNDVAGDGSRQAPWRTAAHAATQVRHPGSTIHLAAGDYEEVAAIILAFGVSLEGAGPTVTRLSARLAQDYLIQLRATENHDGRQSIGGFTIDGQERSLLGGIWVENVNDVTLHDLHFIKCRQRGSVVSAFTDRPEHTEPAVYVRGTCIRDCVYRDCGEIVRGPTGVEQMLGNCTIGGLDGAEISQVTIDDMQGGYGIKFAGTGHFRNVRIHDCDIRVNPDAERWVACASIELWNIGPGCEISHVTVNTWISLVNHPNFTAAAHTANMRLHHCRVISPRPGGSNQEAIEVMTPGVVISDNYFENVGIGLAFWHFAAHDVAIHDNVFHNPEPIAMGWGVHAAIFFDLSSHHCHHVRIHDNRFTGFAFGIYFASHDDAGIGEDITVSRNTFTQIARAVCATGDRPANIRRITFADNRSESAIPVLVEPDGPSVDFTISNHHQE